MNSFYDHSELVKLGFKKLGDDVLISKKASIYGAQDMSVGSHVRIDDFCILSGKITLGSYIHISAYAALYGGQAGIFVEDFANISARNTIYAVCDYFSGAAMAGAMMPSECRLVDARPVYIGKHALLGAHCVVLPGSVISEGSAFGCCSLINGRTSAWSIHAGVPFKKIGSRKQAPLELEKQFISLKE